MLSKEDFTKEIEKVNSKLIKELEEKSVELNDTSSTRNIIKNINKCNPVLNIEYGVSSCDDTSKLCINYNKNDNIHLYNDTYVQKVLTSLSKNTFIGRVGSGAQNTIYYKDKIFLFNVSLASSGVDNNNVILIYNLITNVCEYVDMPYSTSYIKSCVIKDNIAYVQFENYVYKFNLDTYETERYMKVASYSYSLSSTTLQIADDNLYIFGGHSNTTISSMRYIDLNTNTLVEPDITLPYAVEDATAVYYNSAIYLFGGECYTVYNRYALDSICKYDITNNVFTTLDIKLPFTTVNIRSVLLNNKLYIFNDCKLYIFNMDTLTFEDTYDINGYVNSATICGHIIYFTIGSIIHIFNTQDNTFTYNNDNVALTSNISSPTHMLIGSKLYVIAGQGDTSRDSGLVNISCVIDLDTYEKSEFNFSNMSNTSFFNSHTFLYGDKYIIVGGYKSKGVYEFNPEDNSVTLLFSLPKQGIESGSVILKDNYVYIFGYQIYSNNTITQYTDVIRIDLDANTYQILDTQVPYNAMRPILYNNEIYLFSYKNIYKFTTDEQFILMNISFEYDSLYGYAIGLIDDYVYVIGGYYEYVENNVRYSGFCNNIYKFNLQDNSYETLDYKLPIGYKNMGYVVYNNNLFLFGGLLQYKYAVAWVPENMITSHIFKFGDGLDVTKGNYMILSDNDNKFCLINKDNIHLECGIKQLYIGDFFNSPKDITHLAYLYRDGEWKSLQQINNEGDV